MRNMLMNGLNMVTMAAVAVLVLVTAVNAAPAPTTTVTGTAPTQLLQSSPTPASPKFQPASPAPSKPAPTKPVPTLTSPQTRPAETQPAKPMEYVQMTTTKGDIYVELNREKAPITVENFLHYVDKKFYDGTIFHRVIPDFMIQGGGMTPDMQEKSTDAPIKNEWQNGLKNMRGTIAMARTSEADSATAQFFINVVDNPRLDMPGGGGAGYAVFGKVVAGMSVADAIKAVHTVKGTMPEVPVVIQTIKRIKPEDAHKAMEAESKASDKKDSN